MNSLQVRLQWSPTEIQQVGTLAETPDRRIYFEFDSGFLAGGLQLSPMCWPLRPGLIEHTDRAFGALPGLFLDSLPDGWGRLLMDRAFRQRGLTPGAVTPLQRLAFLGTRTMGALTYHPAESADLKLAQIDLAALDTQARELWCGPDIEVLPALLRVGGSPGGARPKVLVGVASAGGPVSIMSGTEDLPEGFDHWLIKFTLAEETDAAQVENAYAQMARSAGIVVPATRLFDLGQGRCAFGVRRFDRSENNQRHHMLSFASLIHADFRVPSCDYADLFKLTAVLTGNHTDMVEVFRRMLFNLASHNRDDHSKNHAFMLDAERQWRLTPAFDLTFSHGPGGEHSMTMLGEGRSPSWALCRELGKQRGLRPGEIGEVCDQVRAALRRWPEFAAANHCEPASIARIGRMHLLE